MMKIRTGRMLAGLAAAVLTLAIAGTASAQVYRMQGGWLQQRGTTYIPSWIVPLGGLNSSVLGLADPTIPGNAFVTVTPASPAPIMNVPQGAFGQPKQGQPGGGGRAIPLQQALSSVFGAGNGGNVVQLTTQFTFSGPNAPAVFQAPGTNLRLAPTFSYCPGAPANPNCTTNVAVGTQGTRAGRMTYTPTSPNRYGGVARMLISSPQTPAGSVAVSLPGNRLRIDVINAGAGGGQHPGMAYGSTNSNVLTGGRVYSTYTQTPNGLVGGVGLVTSTATPDTNLNTGFPWTTGQVRGSEPGGATAMDTPETFTVTGSDNRTPGGRGNLSLVAGGLSHRLVSGQTFVAIDRLTMGIESGRFTPALSPTGVAAIASLMLIGGGYVLRKRL